VVASSGYSANKFLLKICLALLWTLWFKLRFFILEWRWNYPVHGDVFKVVPEIQSRVVLNREEDVLFVPNVHFVHVWYGRARIRGNEFQKKPRNVHGHVFVKAQSPFGDVEHRVIFTLHFRMRLTLPEVLIPETTRDPSDIRIARWFPFPSASFPVKPRSCILRHKFRGCQSFWIFPTASSKRNMRSRIRRRHGTLFFILRRVPLFFLKGF